MAEKITKLAPGQYRVDYGADRWGRDRTVDIGSDVGFSTKAVFRYGDGWISLTPRGDFGTADPTEIGTGEIDRVEYGDGDEKLRWYALEKSEERGELFELDVVLLKKPLSNKFVWDIEKSDNLTVIQQPLFSEMDEADLPVEGIVKRDNTGGWDKDGYKVVHIPDEFIGCVAILRDTGFCLCDVGRIEQIKITDDGGAWVWGGLEYDDKDGTLTAVIPQDFLDSAAYPVTVDPTLGYDTMGAGSVSAGGSNIRAQLVSATEDGTVTDIHVGYSDKDSGDGLKAALYDDIDASETTGDQIGTTSEHTDSIGSTAVWVDWSGLSLSITNGTDYAICAWPESSGSFRGTWVGGTSHRYQWKSYGTWDDPLTIGNTNGWNLSIYLEYTTSGGDETIEAATGSLTLSGAAAFDETFVAATGSLTLSGAAAFDIERPLVAETGSLTLSGAAAFVTDRVIAADTASLTLSGAAEFVADRVVVAETAALTLSGAADLVEDETLAADTATLTLSGAAEFVSDRVIAADTAALSLSGAAELVEDELIACDTASLTLSGAADLVKSVLIAADTATLTLSGAADLVVAKLITADTATLTLSGAAELTVSVVFACDTASLTLSGAAEFVAARVVQADTATLTLSGAAELVEDETLAADTASLTLSGAADILAGRVIAAATGSLTLSGAAALVRALLLQAETGSLTLSGAADLTTVTGNDITAETGVLTLSGAADLSLAAILYPFVGRKDFYAMRQIPYNNASVPLRFSYPIEWDPALVTEITLTIKDRTGTNIRSPEAITLYTATTLGADIARFANTFTLATGSDSPSTGDVLQVVGVEGAEKVIVDGYDSTTRIVTIEGTFDNDYDSGDSVYGCFGDITIDTTTITTFAAGLVMTLLWTPTGSGNDTTEAAKIALSQLDVEGLDKRFQRLYTRAHEAFTKPVNRLADMLDEAERQLRLDLRAARVSYDRIVDQDIIAPALMAKMAWLWALNGDEARADERETIGKEYSGWLQKILNMPIWQDIDQDLSQDTDTDGETTSHEHTFEGSW